jgi:hypothetical protein
MVKNQQKNGRWTTEWGENIPAIVTCTSWCALSLLASGGNYEAEVDRAASYVADNLFKAKRASAIDQAYLEQAASIGMIPTPEVERRVDPSNPDLFVLTATVRWDSRALKKERAVRYSRYCYAP